MGSISDFLEAELLDHVFNAAYTPAATIYLALCTADPTDAGTGAAMNETANAQGYQRTAITFGAAASRRVTQNADVDFPQASGDYAAQITHWAIVTSQTYGAGDMLAHGQFAVPKDIYQNNTPSVASAEVYVEFSAGEISDYLANALLDFAFRNQAFSQPDTYVALLAAIAADDDTGSTITEPSWGSYARVQVNVNGGASPTWDLAAGTTPTVVDNTHQIDFANANGSDTITGMAILDAATLGNLLLFDNGMADQAVGSGDPINFPAGDLDIQAS